MKKIYINFILLSCFVFSTTLLSAQSVDTQKCGEGPATFMETIVENCLPVSHYPNVGLASVKFQEILESKLTCSTEDCLTEEFDCEAIITLWIDAPPAEINADSTEWCFSGDVKFEWRCDSCTLIVPPVSDEVPTDTEGGDEVEDAEELGFNIQVDNNGTAYDNLNLGKIEEVFPNPTSGFIELNLKLEQENSKEVQVLVANTQGKNLMRERYKDVPASNFHTQMNLTSLPKGIYFLSAVVDGVLIGSNKVIIQ